MKSVTNVMRYSFATLLLSVLLTAGIVSCKKWQDPVSQQNPQIANPYCNDPDAVNYNWGFPGKPDNTVCFYASDLFQGTYKLYDTVYDPKSDLFLSADSMIITVSKIAKKKVSVAGMCIDGQKITFSTQAAYLASSDTTVGDSLTLHPGQFFCRTQDTVTGTLMRDKVDTSLIYISLTVVSDTGTTLHVGRARRK